MAFVQSMPPNSVVQSTGVVWESQLGRREAGLAALPAGVALQPLPVKAPTPTSPTVPSEPSPAIVTAALEEAPAPMAMLPAPCRAIASALSAPLVGAQFVGAQKAAMLAAAIGAYDWEHCFE